MNKREKEIISDFSDSLKPKVICHGFEGPCTNEGKRRRQNTAYPNEEMNYVVACDSCFEGIQELWKERWDEYYAERL